MAIFLESRDVYPGYLWRSGCRLKISVVTYFSVTGYVQTMEFYLWVVMEFGGLKSWRALKSFEVLGIQSYTLIPIKRTEQSDERNAVKSIQNFEF